MAIITISRELAALGDETAQELAKLLRYRLVDKQALETRMKSYGVAAQKIEKYDERKPSFWASLSQDRDDYLHYLKASVLAEAEADNAVIIGRGGAVILKHIPGVLSVFLGAPVDIRGERVKSYFHCDTKRARQIIEQSDKDRKGFHRYFFDIEWRHPSSYHLALNTGYLPPPLCALLIKSLRDQLITEAVEETLRSALKERVISHEVKRHILYDRALLIHFLEVEVSQGEAVLYGAASSPALAEAALAAAHEVSGVTAARSEIQIVREYNVIAGPSGGF
ncbi:MAG: cytidylate kinase family protein [Spirochaetaceae bacterium]|jgi:cytidylate kinase|nr:cytidylate kinase family protein [Spirochaetaceae bacterium]